MQNDDFDNSPVFAMHNNDHKNSPVFAMHYHDYGYDKRSLVRPDVTVLVDWV